MSFIADKERSERRVALNSVDNKSKVLFEQISKNEKKKNLSSIERIESQDWFMKNDNTDRW